MLAKFVDDAWKYGLGAAPNCGGIWNHGAADAATEKDPWPA
jgi:hypothetical protein